MTRDTEMDLLVSIDNVGGPLDRIADSLERLTKLAEAAELSRIMADLKAWGGHLDADPSIVERGERMFEGRLRILSDELWQPKEATDETDTDG